MESIKSIMWFLTSFIQEAISLSTTRWYQENLGHVIVLLVDVVLLLLYGVVELFVFLSSIELACLGF